ncbi:MAG: DinB family protein [Chitinophagaceae bacterium]|nr:DinB family protein [Chitinophagaceae bacterium]
MIFNKAKEALNEIVAVLDQLPGQENYTASCPALSGATIGQHTRHVIELYQCLLAGYETAVVNYDDRKRNKLYENDKNEAIAAIREIQNKLELADKPMLIVCQAAGDNITIQSNYNREVLYNLEHCIHHQALIRVALIATDGVLVSDEFGVAPSTIQYRQQCAQ